VSTGGGAFASGIRVKDMALGAIAIAEYVHRVADRYPIYVALHTDHCQATNSILRPAADRGDRAPPGRGRCPTFSTATCSTAAPCRSREPGHRRAAARALPPSEIILEIEAGVVGGRRTGSAAGASAKLYTTPEDTLEVAGG
jgi:fructose-bisphosphate aldolase class II